MKFGIMFANVLFGDGEGAKAIATAADDLGYESIWTVEHVAVPKDYQSPYPYSPSGKMGGPDDITTPELLRFMERVQKGWPDVSAEPAQHATYFVPEKDGGPAHK